MQCFAQEEQRRKPEYSDTDHGLHFGTLRDGWITEVADIERDDHKGKRCGRTWVICQEPIQPFVVLLVMEEEVVAKYKKQEDGKRRQDVCCPTSKHVL